MPASKKRVPRPHPLTHSANQHTPPQATVSGPGGHLGHRPAFRDAGRAGWPRRPERPLPPLSVPPRAPGLAHSATLRRCCLWDLLPRPACPLATQPFRGASGLQSQRDAEQRGSADRTVEHAESLP